MTDWHSFQLGMVAARTTGEPGVQATTSEAAASDGPDIMKDEKTEKQRDWHRGYDHAIMLARSN